MAVVGANPWRPSSFTTSPSVTKPQYDRQHQQAAKACIAHQPWCSWCGATSDLVADHLVPGKPQFGYRTLCRPCNSKRAQGSTGPSSG